MGIEAGGARLGLCPDLAGGRVGLEASRAAPYLLAGDHSTAQGKGGVPASGEDACWDCSGACLVPPRAKAPEGTAALVGQPGEGGFQKMGSLQDGPPLLA